MISKIICAVAWLVLFTLCIALGGLAAALAFNARESGLKTLSITLFILMALVTSLPAIIAPMVKSELKGE